MGNFKINLDRKKLTKDYIDSKQNFESVLTKIKTSNSTSLISKGWFYGAIGFASVAIALGIYFSKNSQPIDSNDQIVQNVDYVSSAVDVAVPTENLNNTVTTPTVEISTMQTSKKSPVAEKITVKPKQNVDLGEKQTTKAKEEQQKVEENNQNPKTTLKNTVPSISGVFNGDISWENFKNSEILIADGYRIKQFSLYYTSRAGDKTVTIDGSKVPQNILNEIENIGLNQRVYVTNILAINTDNEVVRCLSMDLNVKFK
ncbi:MAG: hypothetical protein M9916_11140 [Crocinitomicaceae bacterium]|nr:hypothetical protein [Crocinitomicaceae bacterium]